MPKLGSLTYQLNMRMGEMARYGESKHEAKKEAKSALEAAGEAHNPAYAEGIFSKNTMTSYKQTGHEFIKWLRESYPTIKDLDKVTVEHCTEYLQMRDRNCSPFTVSKDTACLNKLFSYTITKKSAQLRERSLEGITRSRGVKAHDTKYNPNNYRDQIIVSKAFGCRRESIHSGQFSLKDISLFQRNGRLYASLIEKGGRYREAPCLRSMESKIREMYPNIQERGKLDKSRFVELYKKAPEGNRLFSRYTRKIDNHGFRSEYCTELYKEIAAEQSQIRELKHDCSGYDKKIVSECSEALGHSRTRVVVEHYLR